MICVVSCYVTIQISNDLLGSHAYSQYTSSRYELQPNLAGSAFYVPQPPAARYVDKEGAIWIIDDRFLALLDSLAGRLWIWRQEDED